METYLVWITGDSKKLEHGRRMVDADLPSLVALGLEDREGNQGLAERAFMQHMHAMFDRHTILKQTSS